MKKIQYESSELSTPRVLPRRQKKPSNFKKYSMQMMIFILTYASYSWLHFAREGWSIIKTDVESDKKPGLGWEGSSKAGLVDFFFLFAYSFGLFISGVLGDNFPIRIILPIGYLIVAAMVVMISFGGSWEITSVFFYIAFFSISGLCQSIGWPSCIAVMGNWFSKESRGLVFGVWWTCQNMGNICGNLLANLFRETFGMSWMWNFRSMGIIIAAIGILNFFLLVDHPHKVGIVIDPPESNLETVEEVREESEEEVEEIEERLIGDHTKNSNGNNEVAADETSISFWKAWILPGVIPYALCVAFVKCSTYGMLFWLPSYADKELDYDDGEIEVIAIAYDIGTILGSVILGLLTDLTYKRRSPIAFVGLLVGAGLFLLVVFFSDSSKYLVYTIIFFVGFFVGGIFNIVAATAAADLAKGDALKGNDKALATVSGILDGSGSLGAAFGSLIIGVIRNVSWKGVFIFLSCVVFISSIPIFKAFLREIKEIVQIRKENQKAPER